MKAKRLRKKINSPVGNTFETSLMTASIKVKVRTERLANTMPIRARLLPGVSTGGEGRAAAAGSAARGPAARGSAARGSAARGSAEWADGIEAAGSSKGGLAGKEGVELCNNMALAEAAPPVHLHAGYAVVIAGPEGRSSGR